MAMLILDLYVRKLDGCAALDKPIIGNCLLRPAEFVVVKLSQKMNLQA